MLLCPPPHWHPWLGFPFLTSPGLGLPCTESSSLPLSTRSLGDLVAPWSEHHLCADHSAHTPPLTSQTARLAASCQLPSTSTLMCPENSGLCSPASRFFSRRLHPRTGSVAVRAYVVSCPYLQPTSSQLCPATDPRALSVPPAVLECGHSSSSNCPPARPILPCLPHPTPHSPMMQV